MLHLDAIPAVKICRLINANMRKANTLRVKLKWGYNNDGIIFGRIVGRQGQTLHEQFYLGSNVIKQIAELHADFATTLDSFINTRRAGIQRRWDERRKSRAYVEKVASGF